MGGRIVHGSSARLRDLAVLLPFVGLILLMPPVIGLFSFTSSVAGIPLPVLYLFGTWALLIAAAALMASRLRSPDEDDVPAAVMADADPPAPPEIPDPLH